jgi:hypothetical protein
VGTCTEEIKEMCIDRCMLSDGNLAWTCYNNCLMARCGPK